MTIKYAPAQKDCYKEYHGRAYHPAVSEVYSNFVARSGTHSNVPGSTHILFVGLQYFIMDYLIDEWNTTFFDVPKDEACGAHKKLMSAILGYDVDVKYLEDLHDLGHLPLRIKALPEGSLVPYQVSPLTVVNTDDNFAWLTNAIETVLSCENWPIQTSATTSYAYMKNFKKYFAEAGLTEELLPFMGHDFSFRGMFGRQAAAMSGFGHLAAGFAGTDTIPAVIFAEKYYGAKIGEELVGASVDATEHSVTCSWLEEGEIAFFRYLMKEQSPKGILSIVSDTWDFWKLVCEFLPILKDDIMAREGTVVIRPDSGDPVKIICGDPEAEEGSPEYKGLVECLWETFGGTQTDKGYRVLDSHIGAIYGDAITLERQQEICERLLAKNFAPTVVLGIGSFSFQYVTRDTHGSAMKATHVTKDGKDLPIFKDPKTDPGKKSARGLLRVEKIDGDFVMFDNQTREQEAQGLLETVFVNGNLTRTTTLEEIRGRVRETL